MSEVWSSLAWFESDDIDTTSTDGEVVSSLEDTAAISLSTDYLLRDENGEVIQDENGDPLSLEGLSCA